MIYGSLQIRFDVLYHYICIYKCIFSKQINRFPLLSTFSTLSLFPGRRQKVDFVDKTTVHPFVRPAAQHSGDPMADLKILVSVEHCLDWILILATNITVKHSSWIGDRPQTNALPRRSIDRPTSTDDQPLQPSPPATVAETSSLQALPNASEFAFRTTVYDERPQRCGSLSSSGSGKCRLLRVACLRDNRKTQHYSDAQSTSSVMMRNRCRQ